MGANKDGLYVCGLLVDDISNGLYLSNDSSFGLTNISKLNVFVGPNNSGKSRLLRGVFKSTGTTVGWSNSESFEFQRLLEECRDLVLRSGVGVEYKEMVGACFKRISGPFYGISTQEYQRFVDSNRRGSGVSYHWWEINRLIEALSGLDLSFSGSGRFVRDASSMLTSLRGASSEFGKQNVRDLFKIYIPTLRGLRPIADDGDCYLSRTVGDYFPEMGRKTKGTDAKTSLEESVIHTGLNLYSELQERLLGALEQREFVKRFERFLSDTFFDREPVSLIPRISSNASERVVHIKIGSEAEKPIYNLGDGLQQIIIITLPLFLHSDKHLLLFVEEPELYLHPGFQSKLIDVFLRTDIGHYQVFVATHSNQFLDIAIDPRQRTIFRVGKNKLEDGGNPAQEPTFSVNVNANSDFKLLEELGVRNTSVFLSNCTIWVEGITDRLYIREYLRMYQETQGVRQFMEDRDYSFVEYGGSNVTHWSFLDDNGIDVERLCGRLMLISDNDGADKKPGTAKYLRFQKLNDRLGDRFYMLKCVEIENSLPIDVVKRVVCGYEGDDGLGFNEPSDEVFRSTRIGLFIEQKLLKEPSSRKSDNPYMAGGGTLRNKVEFCHKAVECLASMEFIQLTQDAKEIAVRVHEFIGKMN